MKKQRRTFTTEFKYDAAALVLDQGYSVAQACRSLDVGESALRRWMKQLQSERGGVTPITHAMTPEQQKIQALEKQVKQLEQEKEILKKATALLMSDDWNRTR
ncbi:hypothetical protein DKW60_16490 [Leucothrix pacifica]|uniref:Transposase n=1 Tax=Leucothrix pacifica TaxID=1247513 RepID=A0A317CDI1_9GAMM|nr:hypothetical protein DKW60_16490 [Leucothrix pacifica]